MATAEQAKLSGQQRLTTGSLKEDVVRQMVDTAISDIEQVCRPAILGTKD